MENCNLTLQSISHRLAKVRLLDNISLTLSGRQVVTLLGPNGAGKSTLLKSIAAQFYPDSGTVEFNGLQALKNRTAFLKQIGYMPEIAVVLAELKVYEQLQLLAQLKSVAKQNIDEVIELCQLQRVINKRSKHLSLGYKQRLNLAQALLNKPQLILMDEPLNGLDPHLIIEFRHIIKQLKNKSLLIISTHFLAEAQHISDRVLFMQKGKILANEYLAEIDDLEHNYLQLTKKEVDG